MLAEIASGPRPVHQARVGGEQHQDAEGDAVPGEGAEVVPADVAQQPAHGQEGGDERGQTAHYEQAQVRGVQQLAMLEHIVEGGGEQGGDGEEEGEFGGGAPIQAEEQTADDGGTGAGGPGDQRQGLGTADLQGVLPSHVVDPVDPHWVPAPLGPQDQHSADDEGGGHHDGIEHVGLDRLGEQEPQQRRRQEGQDQIDGKAPGTPVRGQPGDHLTDLGPVLPHHGEDGRQLDGDLEYLAALVVEVEQIAGHDQVAGAGDGEELGQALDDAEDQGFQQEDKVHGVREPVLRGPPL